MHAKSAVTTAWPMYGAVIVACTLFAGNVVAKEVTISYQVNAKGLDLRQPVGARMFYIRLKRAARIVCTHGNRIDLQASPDPEGCYEKALGDAIRSANVSLLTQLYLETHTLPEAAARGIDVAVQVATK